ncbi:unnamed protein product [Owenia fusiformis]|uniref:C2H2-type domain-containing protein n=1 Tax=Owenia fusiformis TaxID=6347 RepID=A0A8S4N0C2_OWEFU|nr:unnamed protein product [Owenia fusiformis]
MSKESENYVVSTVDLVLPKQVVDCAHKMLPNTQFKLIAMDQRENTTSEIKLFKQGDESVKINIVVKGRKVKIHQDDTPKDVQETSEHNVEGDADECDVGKDQSPTPETSTGDASSVRRSGRKRKASAVIRQAGIASLSETFDEEDDIEPPSPSTPQATPTKKPRNISTHTVVHDKDSEVNEAVAAAENIHGHGPEFIVREDDEVDMPMGAGASPRIQQNSKCKMCAKSFKSIWMFNKHLDDVHVDDPGFAEYKNEIEVERKLTMKKPSYKREFNVPCKFCKKLFKEEASVLEHTIMKHSEEEFFEEYQEELKERMKSTCIECGKVLSSRYLLKQHLHLIHEIREPQQCQICGNYYKDSERLQLHIKRTHETPAGRHLCHLCPLGFKHPEYLKDHVNSVHYKNCKQTCNICGKELASKRILRSHMKTHSDQKDFQCGECGREFNVRRNLLRHIMLVHKRNEIDFMSCPHCERKFSARSNLAQHIKTVHEGQGGKMICEICNLKFRRKAEFDLHMSNHSTQSRNFKLMTVGGKEVTAVNEGQPLYIQMVMDESNPDSSEKVFYTVNMDNPENPGETIVVENVESLPVSEDANGIESVHILENGEEVHMPEGAQMIQQPDGSIHYTIPNSVNLSEETIANSIAPSISSESVVTTETATQDVAAILSSLGGAASGVNVEDANTAANILADINADMDTQTGVLLAMKDSDEKVILVSDINQV